MNKDIGSRALSDVFPRLIVRRLHTYGIQASFAETRGQYSYDFGAFHEY